MFHWCVLRYLCIQYMHTKIWTSGLWRLDPRSLTSSCSKFIDLTYRIFFLKMMVLQSLEYSSKHLIFKKSNRVYTIWDSTYWVHFRQLEICVLNSGKSGCIYIYETKNYAQFKIMYTLTYIPPPVHICN